MQEEKLFRAFGVLWKPHTNDRGKTHLESQALCPNDSCHTPLRQQGGKWWCIKCEKSYVCKDDFQADAQNANQLWKGHKTLDWPVYSLELPPTKVAAGCEDENYWIQSKIGEKGGKKFAIIFFGEKVYGKQDKTDYAQVFLDLEDEQLRFDRGNKNPMNILCILTAEFRNSIIKQEEK